MTNPQNTVPATQAEFEAVVREAWAETLGHTEFADDEAFLSLDGANSLTAVRVMVGLGGRLGARLQARLIMRHPTVQDLAAAIREQVSP
ncbi:acyl carrier protein [Streptomyces sp. NPDC017949]|uniref:acyl carrier protein n=1 Tax=Streptomyces sp. NPDC017949 TaxID=3365020 RepID=UPI0037A3F715